MAYIQTDWKDHVVEHPKTYTVQDNGDGTYTYEDAPGEIVRQGTPMSATNFNKIEEGVGGSSMMADLLYTLLMLKLGHSAHTLESLDAAKLDADGKAEAAKLADKLTNARTIAISGGATAAGVSFDGSGNITISVTALDPTKLSAAVALAKGGTGATDAAGARTNLDVPSVTDLISALILTDAQRSVDLAVQRDHEERLITVEAQTAALTTT